jgi:ABC-type phosphate/phosphonate transport system substrate-binding protein
LAATPVASLPMYDWPEVQWANDVLWGVFRDRLDALGFAVPKALDRTRPSNEVWRDPGLVLSQTCGFPYAAQLREAVKLVATPVQRAEGCAGPFYASAIIARQDAPDGLAAFATSRFAINGRDSLSGYVALRAAMQAAGLAVDLAQWIETGSHRASVRIVAAGEADCASIDAVCWAMAKECELEAVAGLKVIGWTPLRPALPLITALQRGPEEVALIRSALEDALDMTSTKAARAALHLSGIAVLQEADYAPLAELGT